VSRVPSLDLRLTSPLSLLGRHKRTRFAGEFNLLIHPAFEAGFVESLLHGRRRPSCRACLPSGFGCGAAAWGECFSARVGGAWGINIGKSVDLPHGLRYKRLCRGWLPERGRLYLACV